MKITHRRYLGQKGFLHHAVPILAFVALFCVVGAIFLLRATRAATPGYYIQSTANGSKCLSNLSNQALIEPCSTSSSVATITTSSKGSLIKVKGTCLMVSGSTAIFQASACSGGSSADFWKIGTPLIRPASKTSTCLAGTTGRPLSFQSTCTTIITGTPNYFWQVVPAPSASPAPVPTTGTVDFTRTPVNCHGTVYTVKNGGTFSNCVGAIQQMVGSMDQFDFFNGKAIIGVDGLYGQQTYNAVVAYQKYEKSLGVDGQVGPATWHYLCWSIKNRGLNNTASKNGNNARTARAWNYAECSNDASTPAGK